MRHLSKFLSLVLRHKPQTIGISLDSQGWVSVDLLIEKLNQHPATREKGITRAIIEQVVATNDKKRFSFSYDGTKIRANQGHSIPVDLGLVAETPPPILFHGTAHRNLSSIQKQGLLAQNRQHVHLSLDEKQAKKVGMRHGSPVVLKIMSASMHEQGYDFYCSENGVWLTKHIPIQFIQF